jgi:hypothetical protein
MNVLKQEACKAKLAEHYATVIDEYAKTNSGAIVGMEDVFSTKIPTSLVNQRIDNFFALTVKKLADFTGAEEKATKVAVDKETKVQERLLASKTVDRFDELVIDVVKEHAAPPTATRFRRHCARSGRTTALERRGDARHRRA